MFDEFVCESGVADERERTFLSFSVSPPIILLFVFVRSGEFYELSDFIYILNDIGNFAFGSSTYSFKNSLSANSLT